MLSDKPQVLQLVALLHQHGIQDVVLCPGSRNAPLIHTITACGLFRCHAITDERSAGFFAIGISLAHRRPTAVCVTSGSAVLNLHPAVAEAYYQQVPLVVISADRPAAWIGQMDGQTLPQSGILSTLTRCSVNLPEIHSSQDEWFANRLINEALLEATHRVEGPVHINIPISEPLYTFSTKTLPTVRKIERLVGLGPEHVLHMGRLLANSNRRMIIVGQKPDSRTPNHEYLLDIDRGFVSLCEHMANLGPEHMALMNPDGLIEQIPPGDEELYRPDLLITMGGHIVSQQLKNFLRKYPPQQHWHISSEGEVMDLFGVLTHCIEANPPEATITLAMLTSEQPKHDEAFSQRWKNLVPITQAAYWEHIYELLPPDSVLHLANSTSVRRAQRFRIDANVTVCCNRGVNGIEGSLSAAVGYATATPEKRHFVIIGDLSFFYDQNALWNQSLPRNLHILLINNGGGAIFHTLPLPESPESRKYICAPHHTSAADTCRQHGLQYLAVHNAQEWETVLPTFLNTTESVILEIIQ